MDMKELDRRIHKGVKEIQISPLFEKGKTYNIDHDSEDYGKEDVNGTMSPESSHCWLTWKSKWIDENGVEHWGNEAFNFPSIEDAKVAKEYLEKYIVE